MKFTIGSACVAIVLAGCASTGTEIGKTEKVSSDYRLLNFSVSGKRNANIAAKPFEHNGKVGICAAIGENPETLFGSESVQYLKDGIAFFIDGDRVMSGAPFAPVYTDYKSLGGKTARCAVSDTPWKSNYRGKDVDMSIKPGYIGS